VVAQSGFSISDILFKSPLESLASDLLFLAVGKKGSIFAGFASLACAVAPLRLSFSAGAALNGIKVHVPTKRAFRRRGKAAALPRLRMFLSVARLFSVVKTVLEPYFGGVHA